MNLSLKNRKFLAVLLLANAVLAYAVKGYGVMVGSLVLGVVLLLTKDAPAEFPSRKKLWRAFILQVLSWILVIALVLHQWTTSAFLAGIFTILLMNFIILKIVKANCASCSGNIAAFWIPRRPPATCPHCGSADY